MREDEFIARALRPLAACGDEWDARSLKDDAALLYPRGRYVFTKDLLAEGVHFPQGSAFADAVARAVRVNVSDLAAKGAEPCAYMLGLSLPAAMSTDDAGQAAAALEREQSRWGLKLMGGDTISGVKGLALSVTMIGKAAPYLPVPSRAGARPGDGIYVTGTVGDAFLGLRVVLHPKKMLGIDREHAAFLARRFWLPEPRVALGRRLPGVASASCDVSDGLLLDLKRILAASEVGAELWTDSVPFSPAARAAFEAGMCSPAEAAAGGDDYEILFCAHPGDAAEVARRAPCLVSRIGTVTEGDALVFTGMEAGSFVQIHEQGGGYVHTW